MSNLITGTQLETTPLFSDFRNVDPGLLVLAVSLMNLDTAYNSARNNLQKDDDLFRTLGRLAPLSGKAQKALDAVTQKELQATRSTFEEVTGLQSRYADNLTVNEADNERFRELNAWAADRGITLESATRTITETITEYVEEEVEVEIEVPIKDTSEGKESSQKKKTSDNTENTLGKESTKTEPTESSDTRLPVDGEHLANADGMPLKNKLKKDKSEVPRTALTVSTVGSEETTPKTRTVTIKKTVIREVEKTIERLVTDADAIDRNLAALTRYQSALQGATADNAVLRQAITNLAEVAEIRAGLAATGVSLPLATLRDLKQGVAQLRHWTESLVSTIEAHLDTARTVHTQIEKVSVQINDHQKDAQQVQQRHDSHVEHSDLMEKLERLLEIRKKQAPELSDLLLEAIVESDQFLTDIRTDYLPSATEQRDESWRPTPRTDAPADARRKRTGDRPEDL